MKKFTGMFVILIIIVGTIGFALLNYSEITKSSGLEDNPWPTFRGNAKNTGLSPINTSHIDETKSWNYFLLGTSLHYSPVVDSDGTIYASTYEAETEYLESGQLEAFSREGGTHWWFESEDQMTSPALSDDGTIYVGSYDDNLYALYPNGSEKWSFSAEDDMLSSPNIGYDGTVYIGSADKNLYAVNPDGTKKWNFTTSLNLESSPAIGNNGTVYVGSSDHKLYALNPDGTERWNFTTEKGIISSPALGKDGTIYVGSLDSNLYAVTPNGTKRWSFSTEDGIISSPTISSDEIIYIGSTDGNLYAINANGTESWIFETEGVITSSPVIGNGVIYIISNDDYLYAIGKEEKTDSYFLFPWFCWRDLVIITLLILGVAYLLKRRKERKKVEPPKECLGEYEPTVYDCQVCEYEEECRKERK